jgi:hypothetical protein
MTSNKAVDIENIGKLENIDVAAFGRSFLDRFLQQGFGSLTKREIEVLVINLLKKQAAYEGKSNFALSKALRLPGAKVSSLLYESVLLFETDHEMYFQSGLMKALQKVKLKTKRKDNEESTYTFVLEDKFIRLATHARLKDLGHFADGSFNTEIVSITHSGLIDLLESFITEDEAKKLCETLKRDGAAAQEKHETEEAARLDALAKAISDGNSKITVKGLLNKTLEGAASKGGELVVDWLTTGGVTTVIGSVKNLANFLGAKGAELPNATVA